jgi:L-malate glycosyltransferase
MKVAYLIDDIAAPGGAQKMALWLAQSIVDDPDISLTLISLQSGAVEAFEQGFTQAGCEVHHFGAGRLFDPGRLVRLTRFLRRGGFDLVHTNLVYSNTIGTIAARLAGIPTVGGLRAVYMTHDRKDALRQRIESQVLRRLARGAMAVGPATADGHRKRLAGLALTSIPNPVAVPALPTPELRRRVRESIGVPLDALMVIAVGSLRYNKGYPDLIEAFRLLARHDRGCHLAIAGQGPLRHSLEQSVSDAELAPRVRFLGQRTDVADLMAASDVYVNSSHTEGLSNAILEAMAAGLPVVVTDVGDSAGVVDADVGVVVAPHRPAELAEALIRLASDPTTRASMGTAGRAHVESHHDRERWVEAMIAFYAGAIGRSPIDSGGRAIS